MKFRRFVGSALVATLLTAPISLSHENKKISFSENFTELASSSKYLHGKGVELENCINDTMPLEISRIRRLIGLKDKSNPTIIYTVFPDMVTLGKYYSDTIAIDTSKVYYDRRNTCSELAGHEAGHFGLDNISLEMGNGHWPPQYSMESDSLRFWWDKTVSEGFATLLSGREFKLNLKWPKTISELSHAHHYYLGSRLLSGLVQEFGYKRLIPVVITNPAADSEVFQPQIWQKRIRHLMNAHK